MSNEVTTTNNKPSSVKQFMALPATQKRVNELLGDRASQFLTSVSSMVGADDKLAKCEPVSLFMACLTAAALDLPINKNLGFAHIVPYENNRAGVTEAQFQMGYKGYIQLAKRTGQYKNIAVTEVYEGQLVHEDPLDGNTYDWDAKMSGTIIGYVAKFRELNGFEKELYMSIDKVEEHAKKFSKAYQYDLKPTTKYKNSPWSTNFEKMAKKTVLKLLLNQWATLSIEMQKALAVDQAIIKADETPSYIDGDVIDSEVKANDSEKSAIIAANSEPEVDPSDVTDDELSKAMDEADGVSEQTSLTPEEPKETVAEKARRKYIKK